MDVAQRMIPTEYRAKIPSTVSWPIGAQEVSHALSDVPQFDELRISFSFSMWQKAMLNHWPWLELMRFHYAKGANSLSVSEDMIGRNFLERQWTISVSPVPRAERKRLHDLLLPEVAKGAAWLSKNQSRQALGGLSFKIIWDKEKDTLYTSTEQSAESERIV